MVLFKNLSNENTVARRLTYPRCLLGFGAAIPPPAVLGADERPIKSSPPALLSVTSHLLVTGSMLGGCRLNMVLVMTLSQISLEKVYHLFKFGTALWDSKAYFVITHHLRTTLNFEFF